MEPLKNDKGIKQKILNALYNNDLEYIKNNIGYILNQEHEFVNENGDSLLHIACENNNIEAVELFINHKLDINIINNKGEFPKFYNLIKRNFGDFTDSETDSEEYEITKDSYWYKLYKENRGKRHNICKLLKKAGWKLSY